MYRVYADGREDRCWTCKNLEEVTRIKRILKEKGHKNIIVVKATSRSNINIEIGPGTIINFGTITNITNS
jgi:hypothetical protein